MESGPKEGPDYEAQQVSEERIIGVLKEQEARVSVAELCRKHAMSDASFSKGKANYGGLEVSEAKRLKSRQDENTRLKRLLERFPIRWNHLIEKESLRFKEVEHVLIEKVGQLFRNMP